MASDELESKTPYQLLYTLSPNQTNRFMMTPNRYCDKGLLILNNYESVNDNATSSAYLIDSYDMWHIRFGRVICSFVKKNEYICMIYRILTNILTNVML